MSVLRNSRLHLGREPLLLLILVGICVLVSFESPGFTSSQNLTAILTDSTTIAIVAIGAGLVIINAGIDISVGSILAASATISGIIAQDGGGTLTAVLAGIGAGAALGAVNAALIIGLRIQPIVATLATLGIFRGLLSEATAGKLIGNLPGSFRAVAQDGFLGLPYPVWAMFALGISFTLLMRYTEYGRRIYAIGNNPRAAELVGIRIRRYQVSVYVISGTLAGLVGVFFAARNGTVLPTSGSGVELLAIAAIVVGGVHIFGGRGTIAGIVIAAVLLQVITSAMVALGVDAAWQNAVVGLTILIAVSIFAISHRRRSVASG